MTQTLDNLYEKYDSYQLNEAAGLKKRSKSQYQFAPDITVEYKDTESKLHIKGNHSKFHQETFILSLFIISFFELATIAHHIKNISFSIILFAPVILGIFIYLIFWISLQWEIDSFRYDLKRELKRNL